LSIISKIFGVRKYTPITARFDVGFFGFSIMFLIFKESSLSIYATPNFEGLSTQIVDFIASKPEEENFLV
jgi:hypothetical protein